MTEIAKVFSLDDKSPGELEARRRELVALAKGNVDDLSLDQLRELAAITSALRRRTAGPPKAAKAAKGAKKPKATMDDLMSQL